MGSSPTASGEWHPFLYSGSTMSDLGTLAGGGAYGDANAINDSGQIAGLSHPWPGYATLWTGSSIVDVLGDLGASGQSNAYDINNSGQIVGFTGVGNAFLYDSGTGTVQTLWDGGKAFAINENGQVVGFVSNGTVWQPALYANGTVQILGSLGTGSINFNYDSAYAINDNGQIVGTSQTTSNPWSSHAFIWQDGVMQDLNDLIGPHSGFTLVEARGINSSGQIIANGWYDGQEGAWRGYLLTPNSDPTAVPLPSAGLAGMALLAALGVVKQARSRKP